MTRIVTAAAAVIIASASGALAQSAKLEMSQGPPHIMVAAHAAGALTNITEVGIEVENGRLIFEIKGTGPSGHVREVDVFASGEIDEIEDEIQQADVPQPVMQALQRWLPIFKPTKMERSERPVLGGNGATFLIYEF